MNKQIQQISNIIADDNRIFLIAKDFMKHYKQRQNILKGKAMFVAYNRNIALKYYYKLIEIDPTIKNHIKVIMTPNNQSDTPEMLEIIGSKNYRRQLATDFKDANSNFKIAIVVDMWLTGFDAPSLDVIYIDKPIKMHNLMQTIARVNRVYTDDKNSSITKEAGLVVDYIGIWKKLEEALKFYTNNGDHFDKSNASWMNAEEIKEQLNKHKARIFKICLNNLTIDYQKAMIDPNYRYNIVEKMQEIIIINKHEEQFINLVGSLNRLFNSCLAKLSTKDRIITQLLFLTKSSLIKRELGNFSLSEQIDKIKDMMTDAITYNKTIVYDEIFNEKISLTRMINIIKNTKLNENPHLQTKETQIITQNLIKEVEKINMIKAEKLSNKLNMLLNKYDSNFINIDEFILGLKQIAEEAQNINSEAQNMGISPNEMAFYEILLSDDHSKSEYDKNEIKNIAVEVFEKVKSKINQSWIYNDGMKQKVRAEIFESLIERGYPPKNANIIRKSLVAQLEQQIDRDPNFMEEI